MSSVFFFVFSKKKKLGKKKKTLQSNKHQRLLIDIFFETNYNNASEQPVSSRKNVHLNGSHVLITFSSSPTIAANTCQGEYFIKIHNEQNYF